MGVVYAAADAWAGFTWGRLYSTKRCTFARGLIFFCLDETDAVASLATDTVDREPQAQRARTQRKLRAEGCPGHSDPHPKHTVGVAAPGIGFLLPICELKTLDWPARCSKFTYMVV